MNMRRRASDSSWLEELRNKDNAAFFQSLLTEPHGQAPAARAAQLTPPVPSFGSLERSPHKASDTFFELLSKARGRRGSDASSDETICIAIPLPAPTAAAAAEKSTRNLPSVSLPSNSSQSCSHGAAVGHGLCWECWKTLEKDVLSKVPRSDVDGQDDFSDAGSVCDSLVDYEPNEINSENAQAAHTNGIHSLSSDSTIISSLCWEDYAPEPPVNSLPFNRGTSSLPARLRPICRKSVTFSDEDDICETWHSEDYSRGMTEAEHRQMRRRMVQRAWQIQRETQNALGSGYVDSEEESVDSACSDDDVALPLPRTMDSLLKEGLPMPNLKLFW